MAARMHSGSHPFPGGWVGGGWVGINQYQGLHFQMQVLHEADDYQTITRSGSAKEGLIARATYKM